eukprot:TRINITY_DN7930_c0_g1_i1.p2 TRINITY_DN7930_c0_g1~~TRINITY_DN7930_c0_g1_i1.p2  ORF type:complete len:121 (+),score=8.81 TRINITY_DN7930_c0_g1_i1:74-436(+)
MLSRSPARIFRRYYGNISSNASSTKRHFETDAGIIQVEVQNDVIDLGLGQPSPTLLPTETLAKLFYEGVQARKNSSWKWLQYGQKQGAENFRIQLATFLNSDTDTVGRMSKQNSTQKIRG